MDSKTRIKYIDIAIEEIVKIIPPYESGLIELLNTYSESLFNIAPELRTNAEYFAKVSHILNRNVGEIDSEWKEMLVAKWKEIITIVNLNA
jgi:hypothetical protein